MKFELDRLIDYDDDEILAELRRVAAIAPEGTFSRRIFEQHSRVSAKTVRRRFGSWEAALQQAQLRGRYSGAVVTEKQMVSVAKQMTDAELIDELRRVASNLGRDVVTTRKVDEHSRSGQRFSAAGLGRGNRPWRAPGLKLHGQGSASRTWPAVPCLHRDRFRCVLCGDHPARNADCVLHVDHIIPWSNGGRTREDNLRTLCATCNVGRGNRFLDCVCVCARQGGSTVSYRATA